MSYIIWGLNSEQVWLWPQKAPGMCGQEPCVLPLLFLLLILLLPHLLFLFLNFVMYFMRQPSSLLYNHQTLILRFFSTDRRTVWKNDQQIDKGILRSSSTQSYHWNFAKLLKDREKSLQEELHGAANYMPACFPPFQYLTHKNPLLLTNQGDI